MAWDIGIVSSLLSFSRYQPLGWIHVGFANTWAFMYVPHWYTRNTITSRILGLYMMYAWPQGCSVQKAEVGRANQACALCYPCLNVPDYRLRSCRGRVATRRWSHEPQDFKNRIRRFNWAQGTVPCPSSQTQLNHDGPSQCLSFARDAFILTCGLGMAPVEAGAFQRKSHSQQAPPLLGSPMWLTWDGSLPPGDASKDWSRN